MLEYFDATNVLLDGVMHTFCAGTPQQYRARSAVIHGIATMYEAGGGRTYKQHRNIIVTLERGRQEQRRLVAK